MSFNTSSLSFIQQYLTRYGMTTYTILGNIGLIFNIIIFTRTVHRRNTSSFYILIMSICALIGLNISVIPVIYVLDYPNALNSSLSFCQLQFYFRHGINQMMRTFFILACADRYATTSNNPRIRAFSRYQVAIRIAPLITIFWLLLSIFPTMLRSIKDGSCTTEGRLKSILYSMYALLTLGIIPLTTITVFCVLLYINLKKMRSRIQPIGNMNPLLRKRDWDMIRMLLIEIICYNVTTVPLTIMLVYTSITQTIMKSNDRQQIESFLTYVTTVFLIYLNNCLSFWIYISTSRSFRLEFKNLIIKWYEFITNK